jgi:peptide/nickel transport system ATP-binding protein
MNSNAMRRPRDLLRIEDLHVSFSLMGARITAVRGANLRVLPGKVTALVGESGSGKSVISQTAMGLQPPTARVTGKILFDDPLSDEGPIDILPLPRDGKKIRSIRGGRISHDLPGADDVAVAAAHDRRPDQRVPMRIHFRPRSRRVRERCEDMLGAASASPIRKQAPTTCIPSSCRAACASAR